MGGVKSARKLLKKCNGVVDAMEEQMRKGARNAPEHKLREG